MRFITRSVSSAILACLAVTAMPVSAAEVDGPKVQWRLSTWGNPRAVTAGMEYVAEQVRQKTDGNFTIDIGYAEKYSKARENLDSLKLGAIDAALICNIYHPGKNPALMVYSLPFLPLSDWEVNRAVTQKLNEHPVFKKEMDQWNAMIYVNVLNPQYEFMGRGEPPLKLSDWQGKRVRAGGGLGDAMGKLGAVKTTTTAPDVYMSLQRGTMDAASFPFTYSHASFKIPEVSNWFTSNMAPGTSSCPLVFNKASFEKLPEQYKKMLLEMAPAAYDAQVKAYEDIDKKNLPEFRKKLTEIVYTDAQLEEFRKIAAKPVWDEWVQANKDRFNGQEFIDLILQTAQTAGTKK